MAKKPKKYFTVLETWNYKEKKCSANLCWLYVNYAEAKKHFDALVKAEMWDGILSMRKKDFKIVRTKDYFYVQDRYADNNWVQIEIIEAETRDRFEGCVQ